MTRDEMAVLIATAEGLEARALQLRKLVAATEPENQRTSYAATKLTADQVREIRASGESSTALACRFGVARGTIWSIRARGSHRGVQ